MNIRYIRVMATASEASLSFYEIIIPTAKASGEEDGVVFTDSDENGIYTLNQLESNLLNGKLTINRPGGENVTAVLALVNKQNGTLADVWCFRQTTAEAAATIVPLSINLGEYYDNRADYELRIMVLDDFESLHPLKGKVKL